MQTGSWEPNICIPTIMLIWQLKVNWLAKIFNWFLISWQFFHDFHYAVSWFCCSHFNNMSRISWIYPRGYRSSMWIFCRHILRLKRKAAHGSDNKVQKHVGSAHVSSKCKRIALNRTRPYTVCLRAMRTWTTPQRCQTIQFLYDSSWSRSRILWCYAPIPSHKTNDPDLWICGTEWVHSTTIVRGQDLAFCSGTLHSCPVECEPLAFTLDISWSKFLYFVVRSISCFPLETQDVSAKDPHPGSISPRIYPWYPIHIIEAGRDFLDITNTTTFYYVFWYFSRSTFFVYMGDVNGLPEDFKTPRKEKSGVFWNLRRLTIVIWKKDSHYKKRPKMERLMQCRLECEYVIYLIPSIQFNKKCKTDSCFYPTNLYGSQEVTYR